MKTLIRITTVPMAFKVLLQGQPAFMQQHGFKVIMISADGPERKDVIAKEKCEHIIVPMTRTISPVQDLKCLFQLIKIFKKYKPDIVHTHTPKAGLLGMLAAKICGVKVRMHTIAGLPVMITSGLKKQILKTTERITSAAAGYILPNSKSLYQYMVKEKLAPAEKLSIINNGSTNGIDLKQFSGENLNPDRLIKIKREINFDAYKHKTKILCVGRMVKDKGIEEVIGVFNQLCKTHDLHLILVGPFERDLDALAPSTENEIKNNSAITHINWSDEIEYFMAIADIFVHASHREGFPNVLLQAGAMQVPVVASDIAGNNDIITHNKTGLLFNVKNITDFVSKLRFAIDNTEDINNFAGELKKEVIHLYDRKVMHEAILNKYNTLLSQ